MNEFDKNFIKNMSPLLIAGLVMFFMLVAYETKADDHNITAHGHIVDDKHLVQGKSKPIYAGNIRGAYSKGSNTIVIEMRSREKYELTVSFCWDLPFANGYIFGRQGATKHFNRVEKGLRIWTMSAFGRIDSSPCYVTEVKTLEVVG